MAMQGLTQCAAGCGAPIEDPGNLCRKHRMPGGVVGVNNSTMVVTVWYVEHEGEAGIILLNDFALGDLFGGRVGFEKRLQDQGFTGTRLMCTPEELESAKRPANGKKWAGWSGPWNTTYPWEKSNGHQERRMNKEKCRACGIAETEIPVDMVPGLYICSMKCAEYLDAHPELNPRTTIKAPGVYDVKWPDEPNAYRVRVSHFKDSGSRLYICPCGQAPNPEMQRITAYMTNLDDLSKACRHIGLVMLFERSIAQRTSPSVMTVITPEAGAEIKKLDTEVKSKKLPADEAAAGTIGNLESEIEGFDFDSI
jgi:hypothetical protein